MHLIRIALICGMLLMPAALSQGQSNANNVNTATSDLLATEWDNVPADNASELGALYCVQTLGALTDRLRLQLDPSSGPKAIAQLEAHIKATAPPPPAPPPDPSVFEDTGGAFPMLLAQAVPTNDADRKLTSDALFAKAVTELDSLFKSDRQSLKQVHQAYDKEGYLRAAYYLLSLEASKLNSYGESQEEVSVAEDAVSDANASLGALPNPTSAQLSLAKADLKAAKDQTQKDGRNPGLLPVERDKALAKDLENYRKKADLVASLISAQAAVTAANASLKAAQVTLTTAQTILASNKTAVNNTLEAMKVFRLCFAPSTSDQLRQKIDSYFP